jgi:hypothetical protein
MVATNRNIERMSSSKIGGMVFVTEFFTYPGVQDLFVSIWHAGSELCVVRAEELALFVAKFNSVVKSFSI